MYKFIISIILAIVLVSNFNKIVSIGNSIVDRIYVMVVSDNGPDAKPDTLKSK